MPYNYFQNSINSIVLDDTYQTILFHVADFSWQREALVRFIDEFFQLITSASQIEVIEGADRMSARFYYQQTEFIVNLECTCESIWIEPYTGAQITCFNTLYQEIQSQIKAI